jgi:hypothetical protein
MAIISMAQHASPNSIGQIELARAHPTARLSEVTTTPDSPLN